MNRQLAAAVTIALLIILISACSAPIARHESTVRIQVTELPEDARFLFLLESTLLENGFTIHERALDTAGYRYIVTWTIPSASRQFWQRQYKMRFNGEVVASRATDGWLVEGRFGTFDDQHTASITKDFQTYVVDKVTARLQEES